MHFRGEPIEGIEGIEGIDAQLAAQARMEAALRLRLGQALEVLGRGGCFELGFSSLTAYALERCERSARWVEAARCLARRLETLPALRRAVAFGALSWSKAALLARITTPGDEARWIAMARQLSVRQLSAHLNEGAEQESAADEIQLDGDDPCTLVCTVDREEAWLFEATRALLSQLGTTGSDEQLEALLAEAQVSLLDALPRGAVDLEAECALDTARARRREQLARWRAEAEAQCESRIIEQARERDPEQVGAEHGQSDLGRASATRPCAAPRGAERTNGCEPFGATQLAAAHGSSSLESLGPRELDVIIRNLARALAEHELALSRLILQLHRAGGWHHLGYASETQYARERLGMSRSALLARRALAAKLESLPHVAEALGHSRIGVEAALQLVRIATPKTAAAWLARAQLRTVKHLREEVNAALTAARLSGDAECPPPTEAQLQAFHALERAASSGRIFQSTKSTRTNGCKEAPPPHANAPAHDTPPGDSSPRDAAAPRDVAAPHDTPPGDSPFGNSPPGDALPGDASPRDAAAPHDTANAEKHDRSPMAEAPPCADQGAWRVALASLAEWLEQGVQMSAGHAATSVIRTSPGQKATADVQMSAGQGARSAARPLRHAGRVVLRLRISRETYGWWRSLESQARPWLAPGVSWLRFCCLSLWRAWRHLLDPDIAYGHIYIRDRHRCTSPVCTRRDVTPHHIHFRSAGGSDDDDNVAAVCSWCHLFGIHAGRIRASGSARRIRWELGRGDPWLVVEGRERRAA